MKGFLALTTCLVLVHLSFAEEAQTGYAVKYSGGSLPTTKGGDNLKLFISVKSVRLSKDKNEILSIPTGTVTEINYGREVHRRVGTAAGVAVLTLGVGALIALSKSKKHYIGIVWADGDKKGGIVLQADKNEYRGLIVALEGVTGKKAVNTDEDSKDKIETAAATPAAAPAPSQESAPQQSATAWHHSFVEDELIVARALAQNVTTVSDDLARSTRQLERSLAEAVRSSLDWKSLIESQAQFESSVRSFSTVLNQMISEDEDFLLHRATSVPETEATLRSILANLRARSAFSQNAAHGLNALVQIVNSMALGLRSLPKEVSGGLEFVRLENDQKAAQSTLERYAEKWTYRSGQYAAMLDTPQIRQLDEPSPQIQVAPIVPGAPPPGKAERITNAVADIGTRIYLAHYCPQVRRVPIMSMNANQSQLLQVCMAWGF
jgi:hypothetical protein